MKNSTKIGMAIIAAASILGAAYVYAFTGVVEEKAIMAGTVVSVVEPGNHLGRVGLSPCPTRELP